MERAPCSNSKILIRERAGLNAPVCSNEQASSHCMQLVHFRGSISRALCMVDVLGTRKD